MTSIAQRGTAPLRRLGAAAVLAATALVGTTTSTLGGPATACAAPKFDHGAYSTCWDIAFDQLEAGEITEAEFEEAEWECCYANGGYWDFTLNDCFDPEDPAESPQLPRFPDLGDATATATLTPAPPPSGPPATATSVPPAQIG